MNLQQLQYFQTVARLQHFTKAAQEHVTSQPTLSTAINNLEKELGAQLFQKSGRGVKLTEYGKILLEHVNKALKELEEGIKEIDQSLKMNSNVVHIATSFRLAANILPEILAAFRIYYPQYTVRITQDTQQKLIQLLENGEIDFILGSLSDHIIRNNVLEYKVLFREDIYLLANVNDQISQKDEVVLEDLRNKNLIIFGDTTGFENTTLNYFKDCGFDPKVVYEVSDNYTVESLVSSGLGVAFIGEMKGINKENVKIIRINDKKCKSYIYMCSVEKRYGLL